MLYLTSISKVAGKTNSFQHMVRIQKCKNCRKMFPIKIPIVCPKVLDLDTLYWKVKHNISIYLHQGQPAYFIESNSIQNCNLSTNQKARMFHWKIMQQNKSCVRNPKQTEFTCQSHLCAHVGIFEYAPFIGLFPAGNWSFQSREQQKLNWVEEILHEK